MSQDHQARCAFPLIGGRKESNYGQDKGKYKDKAKGPQACGLMAQQQGIGEKIGREDKHHHKQNLMFQAQKKHRAPPSQSLVLENNSHWLFQYLTISKSS